MVICYNTIRKRIYGCMHISVSAYHYMHYGIVINYWRSFFITSVFSSFNFCAQASKYKMAAYHVQGGFDNIMDFKKESQQSLEIDDTWGRVQGTLHGFNHEKKMLWPPAEVNMAQREKWKRSSLGSSVVRRCHDGQLARCLSFQSGGSESVIVRHFRQIRRSMEPGSLWLTPA